LTSCRLKLSSIGLRVLDVMDSMSAFEALRVGSIPTGPTTTPSWVLRNRLDDSVPRLRPSESSMKRPNKTCNRQNNKDEIPENPIRN